eukprot:5741804-Lingulodinium_polyedra.AAC.1
MPLLAQHALQRGPGATPRQCVSHIGRRRPGPGSSSRPGAVPLLPRPAPRPAPASGDTPRPAR